VILIHMQLPLLSFRCYRYIIHLHRAGFGVELPSRQLNKTTTFSGLPAGDATLQLQLFNGSRTSIPVDPCSNFGLLWEFTVPLTHHWVGVIRYSSDSLLQRALPAISCYLE
jgi:hypothetical protein